MMSNNANTSTVVNYYARYCDRLSSRRFSVGIIGMGYVGLPLALVFAESEIPVLGFDTDFAKVDQINAGESYIRHINSVRVCQTVGQNLKIKADFI